MQTPPPNQQSYGTAIGNSPPAAQKSDSGLEPNIAAALSYIWIVGVIFYLMEKENSFIRFHAMQSILFGIANTVIMMVLVIVGVVLTFAFGVGGAMVGGAVGSLVSLLIWLIWMLFWLIGIALFATLIFAAVKAYQGQKFKLPLIGNMAEKILNPTTEAQPSTKVLSLSTPPQARDSVYVNTDTVQRNQDARSIDIVRTRLNALLAAHPNDFRIINSSKDIDTNKIDISNTEVHGPFDNGDSSIVEILEQSLSKGRQAFVLPVGADRVLVQTAKSGKLFDVQRSTRDAEVSLIMNTLEEIHDRYASDDGNPYLYGGLDSYIYPEKFVSMAEKFGYSKFASYDIADVTILDAVRRFVENRQIVLVSAWTKEERIDVYTRA